MQFDLFDKGADSQPGARQTDIEMLIEEKATIEKGTILVSSWGYDQTNVDFYEVSKVSGQFATVRRLRASAYADDGAMTDKCVPMLGEYMPDAECVDKATLRRKIHDYGYGPQIRINSSASARIWDGTPKTRSWYA